MLDPAAAVRHIELAGFDYVVWIPDSYVGPWDAALAASQRLSLIRPCREGEALAIAAGLMLGGAHPIVVMQCTGLFEAGDALRNVVHDLHLPLKLVVGVRSYQAHIAGRSSDTCPIFTEPILQAWRIPYTLLASASEMSFGVAMRELSAAANARVLLLGE